MKQDVRYTAHNLPKEVEESLDKLRRMSSVAFTCIRLADKAHTTDKVGGLYASEIYELARRIDTAVRTVEMYPLFVETSQHQEGYLRKLSNRLRRIMRSAQADYQVISKIPTNPA